MESECSNPAFAKMMFYTQNYKRYVYYYQSFECLPMTSSEQLSIQNENYYQSFECLPMTSSEQLSIQNENYPTDL